MLAKAFLTAPPEAVRVFTWSHHLRNKAHPLNTPQPGLLCRGLERTTHIWYLSIHFLIT